MLVDNLCLECGDDIPAGTEYCDGCRTAPAPAPAMPVADDAPAPAPAMPLDEPDADEPDDDAPAPAPVEMVVCVECGDIYGDVGAGAGAGVCGKCFIGDARRRGSDRQRKRPAPAPAETPGLDMATVSDAPAPATPFADCVFDDGGCMVCGNPIDHPWYVHYRDVHAWTAMDYQERFQGDRYPLPANAPAPDECRECGKAVRTVGAINVYGVCTGCFVARDSSGKLKVSLGPGLIADGTVGFRIRPDDELPARTPITLSQVLPDPAPANAPATRKRRRPATRKGV